LRIGLCSGRLWGARDTWGAALKEAISLGKPKGESRGLAYLSKRRPRAMEHLLAFFGESGKHLEPRTRFLISVVTKVINFSPRGLQQYVRRALESGASPEEVIDAVLCSYPCAGLTKVVDAIDVILDMNLPGFEEPAQGVERGDPEDAVLPPPAGEGAAPPEPAAAPPSDAGPRRWVAVADLGELPPGGALRVIAGLLDIALFNVDGTIHAIDNRCPHRAGPLVNGRVSGRVVTCPLHAWKFHLETGDSVDHPGSRVRTYPVRIAGGERIEVLLPG
jgi:nitrite reductase/ring-hydroxylating ferredoxin subunit/alkylhydroperoxidase/carboxymuconolactone decarboxylase family protein YurZ